jgi:uncharacterized protein YndB with AHSA1/START domain
MGRWQRGDSAGTDETLRTIERQTMIGAIPAKVFDYLADFTRHADWAAHRLQVTKTSQGAIGVGATFVSEGRMTGTKFHDDFTITEFVPNDRIVFEVTGDAGRFRQSFLLREESGGTRLTKAVEPLRLNGIWKIRWPIGAFVIPHILGGDLKRIKARLEAP